MPLVEIVLNSLQRRSGEQKIMLYVTSRPVKNSRLRNVLRGKRQFPPRSWESNVLWIEALQGERSHIRGHHLRRRHPAAGVHHESSRSLRNTDNFLRRNNESIYFSNECKNRSSLENPSVQHNRFSSSCLSFFKEHKTINAVSTV